MKNKKNKIITISLISFLLLGIVVTAVYFILGQKKQADINLGININIDESFQQQNTPIIVRLKGAEEQTESVDNYYLMTSKQETSEGINIKGANFGKYELSYTSPLSNDGHLYKVPETQIYQLSNTGFTLESSDKDEANTENSSSDSNPNIINADFVKNDEIAKSDELNGLKDKYAEIEEKLSEQDKETLNLAKQDVEKIGTSVETYEQAKIAYDEEQTQMNNVMEEAKARGYKYILKGKFFHFDNPLDYANWRIEYANQVEAGQISLAEGQDLTTYVQNIREVPERLLQQYNAGDQYVKDEFFERDYIHSYDILLLDHIVNLSYLAIEDNSYREKNVAIVDLPLDRLIMENGEIINNEEDLQGKNIILATNLDFVCPPGDISIALNTITFIYKDDKINILWRGNLLEEPRLDLNTKEQ